MSKLGIYRRALTLGFLTLAVTGFLCSAVISPAATVLVPKKAGWRYLDDGSNQGTEWKQPWYNDDFWGFGYAELGYGDDVDGRPEATVLTYGPDEDDRTITYYFRRYFYVSDANALTNLEVKLLRDDGAIVYLNGTEVFRSGMPAGEVTFATLATAPGTEGPDETKYFVGNLPPSALVSGINLIAVEVHQVDQYSPDVSFDLELDGNISPDDEIATLTRGPYLQLATPHSMVVRWRTAEESTSRVRFGTVPTDLHFSVQSADQVHDHELKLTNLAADTRYYYDFGTLKNVIAGDTNYYFRTAPLTEKPTRIWAIGDCGTGTAQARAVFDQYRALTGSRYTDVWLMLGDNAYGVGLDTEYQTAVFDQYPEILRQTALWSTMGNHETYSVENDGEHAYYKIFTLPTAGEAGGEPSGTEHYYSFDYSNVHFVCLDSEESVRTPGSPMLTWLEEDLAANRKAWLIVFWHSPPYTKGSHDSDNLFDNFGNMTEMRQYINPILESYGADLVLCGHSHNYERSFLLDSHYGFADSLQPSMLRDAGSGRPDDTGAYRKPSTGPAPHEGTIYTVAGSAGWATFQVGRHPAMYSALLRMGSLVIDVTGNRLDARFLRETGTIDDTFTILKGAAPEAVRIATIRIVDGTVVARWKSQPGHTYIVEKSTGLQHADWLPASDEIEATGATTTWVSVVLPDPNDCFFRVVQVR